MSRDILLCYSVLSQREKGGVESENLLETFPSSLLLLVRDSRYVTRLCEVCILGQIRSTVRIQHSLFMLSHCLLLPTIFSHNFWTRD